MSGQWVVRDTDNDRETAVETKSEAQEKKRELEQLGMDVEIVPPGNNRADGGGAEVVPAEAEIQRGSIEENPIEWVPEHFVDKIEGVPTINRMGYCVLAERFGVSVTAEPVTLPDETDFEHAQFRATATTEDGQEYSGFGSAHVGRGDDAMLLAELAETRALKRACAWATGVGMTALEELTGGHEHE